MTVLKQNTKKMMHGKKKVPQAAIIINNAANSFIQTKNADVTFIKRNGL